MCTSKVSENIVFAFLQDNDEMSFKALKIL